MTQRGLLRTATLVAALAAAVAASVPARSDVGAAASTPAAVSVVGLRAGDQGPEVVAVQQRLLGFGYVLRAGADGVFGPDTARALRHFQASNGLNPTGVVTENTARYLGLSGGVAAAPPAVAPAPSGGGTVAAALGRHRRRVAARQHGHRRAPAADRHPRYRALPRRRRRRQSSGRRPSTRSYLVQRVNGLPETGVVTEATARALGLAADSPTAPAPRTPATPATPAASGYVGLARGSTGPLVRDVQRALLATGMALRGGADGVFGAATDAALRAYQRVNGLKQSGVVDAATARLMGLGGGGNPPASPGSSTAADGFARFDERGARVVTLQRALINAGIRVRGGADGIFGAATADAVVRFQQAHGLPGTGKVNAATARALGLMARPAPASTPARPSVGMAVAPVAGQCWYGDTWQQARSRGRVHLGTDIGAAEGTPVRAVVTGRISRVLPRPHRFAVGQRPEAAHARRHVLLLRPPRARSPPGSTSACPSRPVRSSATSVTPATPSDLTSTWRSTRAAVPPSTPIRSSEAGVGAC